MGSAGFVEGEVPRQDIPVPGPISTSSQRLQDLSEPAFSQHKPPDFPAIFPSAPASRSCLPSLFFFEPLKTRGRGGPAQALMDSGEGVAIGSPSDESAREKSRTISNTAQRPLDAPSLTQAMAPNPREISQLSWHHYFGRASGMAAGGRGGGRRGGKRAASASWAGGFDCVPCRARKICLLGAFSRRGSERT